LARWSFDNFRLLLFICSIMMPVFTSEAFAENEAKVPDVVIMVVADIDGVNITYSSNVDKKTVETDLNTLLQATGWQKNNIQVVNENNSTFVVFSSGGTINWRDGTLLVEPFAQTFKRYDIIKLHYITPSSGFPFRSLRDYSDRYVDIDWSSENNSHQYTIRIKDHSFDKLNLPLVVDPPKEDSGEGSGRKSKGSMNIWLAFAVAIAAGAVVFIIVNRITRTERSIRV